MREWIEAEPRRSITTLSHDGKRWVCTMRCEQKQPTDPIKAEHPDLAAALLVSFLESYGPGRLFAESERSAGSLHGADAR